MKNKILIKLVVPEIDEEYDIFIPINKRIGNIILLTNKAITEFSNGEYALKDTYSLYNKETGVRYDERLLVRQTDIRNGTNIVLM